MTKYILNSGVLSNNLPAAKRFTAEIVGGFEANPKNIFCFFSQPREDWEERFSKYTTRFIEWCPEGVRVDFELAFPDTFEVD